MDINGDTIQSVGLYPDINYQVTCASGRVYCVPLEPANAGYQAVQAWVKGGGVITDLPLPAED